MKPTNIIEANKKFQKETPQLNFNLEDKGLVGLDTIFRFFDKEDNSHVEELDNAISFLKIDAESVPELQSLIDFLSSYQTALEKGAKNFEAEIDLNKIKYCKTLICYINEDYAELILSTLDFLQDQMVDTIGIDKNRVFFFPSEGFCQVRSDIQRNKEGVPIGDEYYGGKGPLQYRWRDEDFFEVLYKGRWQKAETIDFEFPFEHLRVK